MPTQLSSLAVQLIAMLDASPQRALTVVTAKHRICTDHGCITDFRAAVSLAVASGWVRWSEDYLTLQLEPQGQAMLEQRLAFTDL